MLVFESCTAGYGGAPVFRNLGFSVAAGELYAIIGRSGCGKTTLLSAAAGLHRLEAGAVLRDGEPILAPHPRVGLVPQQPGLFPWYTVSRNVGLGLEISGIRRRSREYSDRVSRALEAVGLTHLRSRYPARLSGGEAQRVSLARTLVREPDVLLLDEPFSALDAITREALQDDLMKLLSLRRLAAVLVTHSIEEAVFLGSRIAIMCGSPAGLTELPSGPDRSTRTWSRIDQAYTEQCRDVRKRFGALHG